MSVIHIMSTRFITFLLLLFIPFYWGDVEAAAQSQDFIQVQVTDYQSEEPVPGAGVALYYKGERLDSTLTDVRGMAELSPTSTDAGDPANGIPNSFEVSRNYPNPFSNETQLNLAVSEDQNITAEVYNILGQRLLSRELSFSAGTYQLDLSLSHLSTGVYLVRFSGHDQKTVAITKTGHQTTATGTATGVPSIRVSGGMDEKIPMRTGETSQDSTQSSTEPASRTGVNHSFNENNSEQQYEIRIGKEGYVTWAGFLDHADETPVEAALRRAYHVKMITLNDQGEEVPALLELSGGGISRSVETPAEVRLPAGTYQLAGQSDSDYFQETIKITSDMEISLRPAGSLKGIKLQGDEQLPVSEATYDLHFRIRQQEDEISDFSDDINEWRVLRTEMEVTFDPEATVGEVNAFLDKYDAGIVSMLEGMSLVVIRYPDPENMDKLRELVEAVESEEIVIYAVTSGITEKKLILSEQEEERKKIPAGIFNLLRIDHHLAIRGHGAWNARSYLQDHGQKPWLVIADAFGDDAPEGDEFATDIIDSGDFGEDNQRDHGYHVLGIITGAFDEVSFATQGVDDVTGIFPDDINVRGVDLQTNEAGTWPRRMNLIISRIKDILEDDPEARIIVNTSLNSRGAYDNQNKPAVSWIQRVRGGWLSAMIPGAGLEHKFMHFTSAGNATYWNGVTMPPEDHWPARDNSMFAYAALGDVSMSIIGYSMDVPNLTNTFVVENRRNSLQDSAENLRPVPKCANDSSVMNGNLSGIGTDVWSFTSTWPGDATGTSMSTPQAAGVAALAWSLDPQLSVLQLKDLILRTAEKRLVNSMDEEDCNDIYPQPVVDAYAAVLRAGGSDVRKAILDVNGNDRFDEADMQEFLDAFESEVGNLDYSRYDLNADGRTGGDGRDRFDLSMNNHYVRVTYEAMGYELSLNENSLEDVDILCYYAWSDLYEGDLEIRDELLEVPCGIEGRRNAPVAVDDNANVFLGNSVTIQVLANDYTPVPREDIRVHEVNKTLLNGTVTIVDNGTAIRYNPEPGFTGVEIFEYTVINDSGLISYPAKVLVNVWEFLSPYRPQVDFTQFNRIDIMLQNDLRDFILSGLTPDGTKKGLFVDRHGFSTELESLGGDVTRVEALNSNGLVVGSSLNENELQQPFRWHRDNRMAPLPPPDSDSELLVEPKHSEQNSPGYGSIATTSLQSGFPSNSKLEKLSDRVDAFVSSAAALLPVEFRGLLHMPHVTTLTDSSGQDAQVELVMPGSAVDVNDQGIITGFYGPYVSVWTDDGVLNLSDHLRQFGMATSINSENQVAGVLTDPETSGMYGFIWYDQEGSGLHDGDLSHIENDTLIAIDFPEGSMSMVTALSDAGHVIGYVAPERTEVEEMSVEPFLRTPGGEMIFIGTLGGDSGLAMDINTHQQVVGTAQLENGESAGFLWMDGVMYDINNFVHDETFRIGAVFDITDEGVMSVVGFTSDGEMEVRLLDPDIDSMR